MDMRDKELIRVIPLLVMLSEMLDVRTVRDWSKVFQTQETIEYMDWEGSERAIDRNQLINYVVRKIHFDFPNFVTAGHGPDSPITPMDEQAVKKMVLSESDIMELEELEHTHQYVLFVIQSLPQREILHRCLGGSYEPEKSKRAFIQQHRRVNKASSPNIERARNCIREISS